MTGMTDPLTAEEAGLLFMETLAFLVGILGGCALIILARALAQRPAAPTTPTDAQPAPLPAPLATTVAEYPWLPPMGLMPPPSAVALAAQTQMQRELVGLAATPHSMPRQWLAPCRGWSERETTALGHLRWEIAVGARSEYPQRAMSANDHLLITHAFTLDDVLVAIIHQTPRRTWRDGR